MRHSSIRGRINWNPIGVWPRETGVPEEACRFRVPAIKILRLKRREEIESRRIALPDHDSSSICVSSPATSISRKNARAGGYVTRLENTIRSKDPRALFFFERSTSFIRIFIRNSSIVVAKIFLSILLENAIRISLKQGSLSLPFHGQRC